MSKKSKSSPRSPSKTAVKSLSSSSGRSVVIAKRATGSQILGTLKISNANIKVGQTAARVATKKKSR